MAADIKHRLAKLEEGVHEIIQLQIKQKCNSESHSRSSCPVSCERIVISNESVKSGSALSRSISAPSKLNVIDVNDSVHMKQQVVDGKKGKKKRKGRAGSPVKIPTAVSMYIANLEKSLHSKNKDNHSVNAQISNENSSAEIFCTNDSVLNQNICANKHKSWKSTKHIKIEIRKLKHQLDDLENSKKDAIEITKKILSEREARRTLRNLNRGCSSTTQTRNTSCGSRILQISEPSQTSTAALKNDILFKQQEGLIKRLKESNQELLAKNAHLTKSLQSSQAQLQRNRKSFDKFEHLLEENLRLSLKMAKLEDEIGKKNMKNVKMVKTAGELADDLRQKDEINSRLNEKVDGLKQNITEMSEMNNSLLQKNNDLCNQLAERERNYIEINVKYKDVEDKISMFISKMQKSQSEIDHLKQMVNDQSKQDLAKIKELEQLRDNIKEYKKRENEFINEIKYLMKTTRLLREEKEQYEENANMEMKKLLNDVEMSQNVINELQNKLCKYEQLDVKTNTRLNTAEEIMSLTRTISDNENHLNKEKEELKALVQELTNLVTSQRDRIDELVNFNKQQEQTLELQKEELLAKQKEMQKTQEEAANISHQCAELQKEVNQLTEAVKCLEEGKQNEATKEDIANLKKQLEDALLLLDQEKEKIQIKNAIINDQNATISQLKIEILQKKEDIRKARDDLTRVTKDITLKMEEHTKIHHQLEVERQEKEILYDNIEKLEQCKDHMLAKFNDLEGDFTVYYEEANSAKKSIENQNVIILTLKQQLKEQEHNWMKNSQLLMHEKEKAVDAAKFATQKLVDTVHDFQKQVDAHQHIQKMLTALLQEKDDKIRNTIQHMNNVSSELSKTSLLSTIRNQFPMDGDFNQNANSGDGVCFNVRNDVEGVTGRKEMSTCKLNWQGDCNLLLDDNIFIAGNMSTNNRSVCESLVSDDANDPIEDAISMTSVSTLRSRKRMKYSCSAYGDKDDNDVIRTAIGVSNQEIQELNAICPEDSYYFGMENRRDNITNRNNNCSLKKAPASYIRSQYKINKENYRNNNIHVRGDAEMILDGNIPHRYTWTLPRTQNPVLVQFLLRLCFCFFGIMVVLAAGIYELITRIYRKILNKQNGKAKLKMLL